MGEFWDTLKLFVTDPSPIFYKSRGCKMIRVELNSNYTCMVCQECESKYFISIWSRGQEKPHQYVSMCNSCYTILQNSVEILNNAEINGTFAVEVGPEFE